MDLTENIYLNPCSYMNSPARTPDVDPINLHNVAHCVCDDLLRANSVARRQTIQQDIYAQCLLDTFDEVLSDDFDDGWLEEDWSY